MRSSISWIDREGLATTLARLGATSRPAVELEPEPVVDEDEEFDVTPVLTPAALAIAPAAPEPAPLNGVAASHEIDAFTPPEGALRMRLESFIEWLLVCTGNQVAFIVDRDGLPLVDRKADPDLLAIAASVMQLIESINGKLLFPLGSTVSLELESDQLTLTSVETPIGKYIVGQVGDRHLDRALRSALADGLRRAFRPSDESASSSGA